MTLYRPNSFIRFLTAIIFFKFLKAQIDAMINEKLHLNIRIEKVRIEQNKKPPFLSQGGEIKMQLEDVDM